MTQEFIQCIEHRSQYTLSLLNHLTDTPSYQPFRRAELIDDIAGEINQLFNALETVTFPMLVQQGYQNELNRLKDIKFLITRFALPDMQSLPAESPLVSLRAKSLRALLHNKFVNEVLPELANRFSALPKRTQQVLSQRGLAEFESSCHSTKSKVCH